MQKRMAISILTSICILALVGGCGEDECTCPECPGEPDYFPLAVGNWWAFQSDTVSDYLGGDELSWSVDTLRVIRRELTPAIVTFVERAYCMWVQPLEEDPEIYSHIRDTIRVEIEAEEILQVWAPVCYWQEDWRYSRCAILHLPITLGDSWEAYPDTCIRCSDIIEICEVSHRLTVSEHFPYFSTPAGEFENVFKVECDGMPSSNLFISGSLGPTLYAADVGPIKHVSVPSSDPDVGSYLVDYSVENP